MSCLPPPAETTSIRWDVDAAVCQVCGDWHKLIDETRPAHQPEGVDQLTMVSNDTQDVTCGVRQETGGWTGWWTGWWTGIKTPWMHLFTTAKCCSQLLSVLCSTFVHCLSFPVCVWSWMVHHQWIHTLFSQLIITYVYCLSHNSEKCLSQCPWAQIWHL